MERSVEYIGDGYIGIAPDRLEEALRRYNGSVAVALSDDP